MWDFDDDRPEYAWHRANHYLKAALDCGPDALEAKAKHARDAMIALKQYKEMLATWPTTP